MSPSSISGINILPEPEKRAFYSRLIPQEVFDRFQLSSTLVDRDGNNLFVTDCPSGSSSAELALYHQHGYRDPILYGHFSDTITGQLHILLYIINDPASPRFDIDRMPDGTPTEFGILYRNRAAELAALQAGLAPGQVRRGMRLLFPAALTFEQFIASMSHRLYFAEPLFYHNAILFERYGFAYQKGRMLMEHIQTGFSPGGELLKLLDSSDPFRHPAAAESIRLRSWAIHDGLLGEPFTGVTMYKMVGKASGISTCPKCQW